MTAPSCPFCPNERQHHERAWEAIKDIPSYKTEMRDGYYRSALESARRACCHCWPACPTCGKTEKRDRAQFVEVPSGV